MIPVRTARPDVAILEAHHLWPVAVDHEQVAKSIFTEDCRMNACRGSHAHAAIGIKHSCWSKSVDTRARALQPAQMRSQFTPLNRHPIGTNDISLLQTGLKFFRVCDTLHICVRCLAQYFLRFRGKLIATYYF